MKSRQKNINYESLKSRYLHKLENLIKTVLVNNRLMPIKICNLKNMFGCQFQRNS